MVPRNSLLPVVYIFCLCSLAAGIAAAESSKPAKPAAGKYTLKNTVNTFSVDKLEKTEAGYQYWFVDKEFLDGRTLKLSVVAPGKATHEPHSHSEDEFFFVLEGKAEFYLDGKTTVVGPYTSLYCPSKSQHGIRNAGNTELKYLVIKKYDKVE
jgi:mannose-6-phosphate isomerase-like protein (cupin superfamily)